MAECMTSLMICRAKSSQELYTITYFQQIFNCEYDVGPGDIPCSPFAYISNVQGLPTVSEMFENKLNNFSKLFAILHADDTLLVPVS